MNEEERISMEIQIKYGNALKKVDEFQQKAKTLLNKINIDKNSFNIDTTKFNKSFQSMSKNISKSKEEINKFLSSLRNSTSKASSAGKSIGNAISKGISGGLNSLKSLGSYIIKVFKSYSRSFLKIGKEFGIMISKGIIACANLFKNVGKTITRFISAGIRGSYNIISSAIKGLSGIINSAFSGVLNTTKSLTSNIGSYISNALNQKGRASLELDLNANAGKSSLGNMFSGAMMANAIKGSMNNITAAMPKQLGNVTTALTNSLLTTATKVKDFGMLSSQVYYLVKSNWSKIAAVGSTLMPVIKSVFSKAGSIFPTIFKSIFSKLGASLIQFISPLVNKIISAAQTYLAPAINKLVSPIVGGFNMVKEGCIVAGRALISYFTPIIKSAGLSFGEIKTAGKGLLDIFTILGKNIITALQPALQGVSSAFGGLVKIFNMSAEPLKALARIVGNVIQVLGHFVNTLGIIIKGIAGIISTALQPLATVVSSIMNKFANAITPVINGLSKFNTKLDEAMSSMVSSVRNWISKLTVKTPSSKASKKEANNQKYNTANTKVNQDQYKAEKATAEQAKATEEAMSKLEKELSNVSSKVTQTTSSFSNFGRATDNLNNSTKSNIKNPSTSGYKVKQNNSSKFNNSDEMFNNMRNAYNKMADDMVAKLNATGNSSKAFTGIKDQAMKAGKSIDGVVTALGKYSILASKIRHPFATLKAEMAKRALESVAISAKKTVTSFNECRKAVERFKNASSGMGKVKAGLDVVTNGAKTAMHGLSTVFKSTAIAKMVNKMKKPTEKASKELSKSVPGGSKTLGFFKSALGKLTMLFGGFAIFNTFKESTKDAINFEASMNNLVSTLGSASVAMQDWINNQAIGFGMGKKEAANYANTFSILTSGFSRDVKECQQTTQELLQQATIVASKTGRDVDDVLERFRSGILGRNVHAQLKFL